MAGSTAAVILLISRAAATPTLRAHQSALRAAGITQDGQAPTDFQASLVEALGVDPAAFEAAMKATRETQRDEARRRQEVEIARARLAFRPHLRIIPERQIPRPIFVAAWTGVDFWLVEALPEDILTMPIARQLHAIGAIARAHYARRHGRVGPFGMIRGYLFRTEFERAIELDADGMSCGHHDGFVPEPQAFLSLK